MEKLNTKQSVGFLVSLLFVLLAVVATGLFFLLWSPSFFSVLASDAVLSILIPLVVWVGCLGMLFVGHQKTQAYIKQAQINEVKALQGLRYVEQVLNQLVEGKAVQTHFVVEQKEIHRLLTVLQNQHQQNLEQDKIRAWTIEGLAKFADLLREYRDIQQLCEQLITALCKYVNAAQGMILQTAPTNPHQLEITACYACADKQQLSKQLNSGSDLIQQVIQTQKPLYLTPIPDGFITLSTSLVDHQPTALAIVPLLLNDQLVGLFELACFRAFTPAEQAFLEQIAERTAATLTGLRQNQQTLEMLHQSQRLTEELKSREAELLRSAEQIRATSLQLNESQLQLQAITASVPEAIYQLAYDRTPKNYRFVYISARAETLFGETASSLVSGSRKLQFIDEPDFLMALQTSATQNTPLQWQGQLKAFDQIRWFEFTGTPHLEAQNPEVTIWNGTIADITSRRAQEQALKLKESAIESASSGIVIMEALNNGLAIISVNPAFEKITGYQLQDVIGRSFYFLFGQDTEQPEIQALNSAVSAGQPIDVMVRSYNKAGQLFWNEMHISPVRDQTGLVKHYVVIINDRTAQKNSEDAVLKSEKLAVLGTLVAGVAHEINTPMGAIKAAGENMKEFLPFLIGELPTMLKSMPEDKAQLFTALLTFGTKHATTGLSTREARNFCSNLRKTLSEQHNIEIDKDTGDKLVLLGFRPDSEGDLTPFLPLITDADAEKLLQAAYSVIQLQKSLQIIEHSASKTTRIVYALKSYSHFKTEPVLEDVNLQEGLENILILYHHQLKQGIEVTTNFQPVPTIRGYANELEQVWTNIIFNAMQAMNYNGNLTIDLHQNDDRVVLRFIDSGPGIPDHVLPRIFDPFFTTKPQGQGTGLGLDICKKIIEKHKGTITVEETMPGKTVFCVTLPIVAATAE